MKKEIPPKSVTVKIFGSEYPIKGDADPAYVARLAKYVDERMRELAGGATTGVSVRVAIMAALNITDELFQVRNEFKKLETIPRIDTLEQQIQPLLYLLDEALMSKNETES